VTRTAAKPRPPKVLGRPNTRRISRIAGCLELSFTNTSEQFTPFGLGWLCGCVMDFKNEKQESKDEFPSNFQR
jgi:hypothetical protein